MVRSRDQNARRSHRIRIDNSSFEKVEEFKYLGTTLINQNSIQEEIKTRLKSSQTFYHKEQKRRSSNWLSNNLKSTIYGIVILPIVLFGCETWSLTLRDESGLSVFENRVLRRIFWPKK